MASHAKHLLRLITDLTTMALSTSSPSQIDQLEDVLALLNDLYGKCGDELQLGTWYNMHDDHADALAKLRRTAEYAFPQPLVVDGVIDSTARVNIAMRVSLTHHIVVTKGSQPRTFQHLEKYMHRSQGFGLPMPRELVDDALTFAPPRREQHHE